MTAEEINAALIADGWKIFPTHQHEIMPETLFCKSFAGHEKCCLNEPKNKQVEVYHIAAGRMPDGGGWVDSWRVEVAGEMANGEWLKLKIGGLSTLDAINTHVQFLLETWDRAAKSMKNRTP
jgi:hypothetical protein